MSLQGYQLRTRAKNADSHPGLLDRTTGRRSREEVAQEKKEKEDAKKMQKQQQELTFASKARRIAAVEKQIDEDDAVNETPRPGADKQLKRRLRRTASYLQVPLEGNDSDEFLDKMDVDSFNDIPSTDGGDEYQPAGVNHGNRPETEEEKTETESEAPVKKKKKVMKVKVSMRDTVAAFRGTADNSANNSEDEGPLALQVGGKTSNWVGKGKGTSSGNKRTSDSDKAHMHVTNLGVSEKSNGDRDRAVKLKTTTTSGFESNEYNKDQDSGLIDVEKWAASIKPNSRLRTQLASKSTSSLTNTSSRTSNPARSSGSADLARLSGPSHPSARSALTNTVKVTGDSDNGEVEIVEVGFLSEHDETAGEEREFAVKSPPKGGKRVSNSAIVKLETISPKPTARTKKSTTTVVKMKPLSGPIVVKRGEKSRNKPSNGKLPSKCHEDGIWRKRVIPTFFRWAGVQSNPFGISEAKIADALKIICDEYYGDSIPLDFSISGVPLRLVVQRLSEWRNRFGSSALASLNAFFDSQDKYRNSDEKCQEFARHALTMYRFVYRNAVGDNKKKFHGLFAGALVVQCFATHFNAIKGSKNILGMYGDVDEPGKVPLPRATLALSASATERALVLTATGTITIAAIREAQTTKKAIKMPTMVNPETGVESTRYTAFSDSSWGGATRSFLATLNKKVSDDAMKQIMDDAAAYAKAAADEDDLSSGSVDLDDERAQLTEGSDDDDL